MMALRDAAAGPARVPRDNAFYSFCCAEFLTPAVSDGEGDGGQKALEEGGRALILLTETQL